MGKDLKINRLKKSNGITLIALVVTAKVGHIPSVRTRVGFSLITPL